MINTVKGKNILFNITFAALFKIIFTCTGYVKWQL